MEHFDLLKRILSENFKIDSDIGPSSHLIEEYGFESITLMELAKHLSEGINATIPQREAASWTTVDSIVTSIRKYAP
jgi:acyl carrier protein